MDERAGGGARREGRRRLIAAASPEKAVGKTEDGRGPRGLGTRGSGGA